MKCFRFETIKKNEIISDQFPWSTFRIRCRFSNVNPVSRTEYLWLEIEPVSYKEYKIVIHATTLEGEIARIEVERSHPINFLREGFDASSLIEDNDGVTLSIPDTTGECLQLVIPHKVFHAMTVRF